MRTMFAEANGKISAIRVQSFMVLLVTLTVFVAGHFSEKPLSLDTLLILLLFAFAPKVAQKVAEQKSEASRDPK